MRDLHQPFALRSAAEVTVEVLARPERDGFEESGRTPYLIVGTLGAAYAANTYSSSHALIGRTYPNAPDLDAAFGRTYVVDSLSRVHETRRGDVVRRYTYDASGELTSQGDWQRILGGCYTDPDYGVRCAYTGEGIVAGSSRSYAYDLVGNPADTGTTINPGNRLARFNGDVIVYDPDGNVVQRSRIASPNTFNQVLTWNSANQLAAVTTTRNGATSTLQFGYDGSGRRIRKTVVGGNDTHYVWDGDQIVAETDASGVTQRLYTYFPGTDQLNSVVAGGQTYYAAQDAAGNVIGMIDRNTMSAKDTYRYQPFGTMDQNDQNVPNSMRWKGLLYDAESGLYYVRARYYAPEMGRFLSEDPIGLAGGINQYTFAGNDPVNGADPSGRCTIDVTDVIGLVSGTVYSHTETFREDCYGEGPLGGGIGPHNGPVPSWDAPTAPAPHNNGGGQPSAPPSPQQGPWPSCAQTSFNGSHGTIHVQTHSNGTVAWGIYMNDPIANDGPWFVDVLINGKRVDQKTQLYAPHGSVSPFTAKSGRLLTFQARHSDITNRLYKNIPNGCYIP